MVTPRGPPGHGAKPPPRQQAGVSLSHTLQSLRAAVGGRLRGSGLHVSVLRVLKTLSVLTGRLADESHLSRVVCSLV